MKATIGFGVYAGIKHEGIDVGKKAVEKVSTDAHCLSLVKSVTVEQIFLGRVRQEDLHLLFGDLVANALLCIAPS